MTKDAMDNNRGRNRRRIAAGRARKALICKLRGHVWERHYIAASDPGQREYYHDQSRPPAPGLPPVTEVQPNESNFRVCRRCGENGWVV